MASIELQRNMAHKIQKLLSQFPAVAILGARQVGKTTLAKQVTSDWQYMDLENPRDYDRISYDPNFFFEQYPQHVIIDEAQIYPQLFNVLRGVIDAQRSTTNRFIITGSSSLELTKNIAESLAGRIALVELGTLKVNELCAQPLSDFYNIFTNTGLELTQLPLQNATAHRNYDQIMQAWLYGGYPEPCRNHNAEFYWQWMENYYTTYTQRDIAQLFPKLNAHNFRRFLMMLSKLSSTILNKSDIARALEITEPTVKHYIDIITGTFFWRQLPSYEKNIIKAVIKMPKGHIRDSGILHHLLHIQTVEALYNHPIIGASFEAFVIEELIKGLQATMCTNWQVYYYRTKNGAEIDLVLDGPFGTIPIEIKHGSSIKLKQLTTLSAFLKEHNLPLGILINQAQSIQWLTPNILQVPVGWI